MSQCENKKRILIILPKYQFNSEVTNLSFLHTALSRCRRRNNIGAEFTTVGGGITISKTDAPSVRETRTCCKDRGGVTIHNIRCSRCRYTVAAKLFTEESSVLTTGIGTATAGSIWGSTAEEPPMY